MSGSRLGRSDSERGTGLPQAIGRSLGGRLGATCLILGTVGVALIGLAGCASHQVPCTLIPAQLDLARAQRDKAMTLFQQKKDDVDRQKSNNDVSNERLKSLTQERDELKAQYGDVVDPTKGGK